MMTQQQYEANNALIRAEYQRTIGLLQAEFAPVKYDTQVELTRLQLQMTDEIQQLARPNEDPAAPDYVTKCAEYLKARSEIDNRYRIERENIKTAYRLRSAEHYTKMAEARRLYEHNKAVNAKEYSEWVKERHARKAAAAAAHLATLTGTATSAEEGGEA